MTPREKGKWFERKVNEILKANGMVTTPLSDGYFDEQNNKYIMTGDGGVDITVQNLGINFIVQCKCHQKPINGSIVREVKGIISTKKDTLGVICALSYSRNAINEANNSNGKIILTNINNIVESIKSAATQLLQPRVNVTITYGHARKVQCTAEMINLEEVADGKINYQS